MKKIFSNQRGFALLNVVLLTLITSFAAMILLNAVPRAKNPQSTLRLTALYVANEQFAQLESLATAGELNTGNYSFQGKPEDLTTENAGAPIKFTVTTNVTNGSGNLRKVSVKVSWKFNGKDFEIASERMMRVVPKTES
ncbi:MAG: hypothetical protein IJ685_07860 [Selenomonadaceae bacterium]|nr:hypothetical protein [Selenomonadaceae bacterium]